MTKQYGSLLALLCFAGLLSIGFATYKPYNPYSYGGATRIDVVGRICPANNPYYFLSITNKYYYGYYGYTTALSSPRPKAQHWALITDSYLVKYGKFLIVSYPRLDYALAVNTIYPKGWNKGGAIRTIKVVPIKHRFAHGAPYYHLGDKFLWSAELVQPYGHHSYYSARYFIRHCETGLVLTNLYYYKYNLVVADEQGEPSSGDLATQSWSFNRKDYKY